MIGTEKNPFLGTAEIRLIGDHFTPDYPVQNGPNVGAKAIGVFGGLDLHGVPRTVSWTRLSAPIASSDNTLEVLDAVDWVVGDEIIVASTSYNSSEAEKRKITAVSGNKKTLTVDAAFDFSHIGMYSCWLVNILISFHMYVIWISNIKESLILSLRKSAVIQQRKCC